MWRRELYSEKDREELKALMARNFRGEIGEAAFSLRRVVGDVHKTPTGRLREIRAAVVEGFLIAGEKGTLVVTEAKPNAITHTIRAGACFLAVLTALRYLTEILTADLRVAAAPLAGMCLWYILLLPGSYACTRALMYYHYTRFLKRLRELV